MRYLPPEVLELIIQRLDPITMSLCLRVSRTVRSIASVRKGEAMDFRSCRKKDAERLTDKTLSRSFVSFALLYDRMICEGTGFSTVGILRLLRSGVTDIDVTNTGTFCPVEMNGLLHNRYNWRLPYGSVIRCNAFLPAHRWATIMQDSLEQHIGLSLVVRNRYNNSRVTLTSGNTADATLWCSSCERPDMGAYGVCDDCSDRYCFACAVTRLVCRDSGPEGRTVCQRCVDAYTCRTCPYISYHLDCKGTGSHRCYTCGDVGAMCTRSDSDKCEYTPNCNRGTKNCITIGEAARVLGHSITDKFEDPVDLLTKNHAILTAIYQENPPRRRTVPTEDYGKSAAEVHQA
jgi:hypothetical protein